MHFETSLTPDNSQLQDLNKSGSSSANAIHCTNSEAICELVSHSISDASRIAYESDLRHFKAWGGSLPASPTKVAAYIAMHAGALSVATIARRVATLSKAHQVIGGDNPCHSLVVRASLQGLRRKHGTAQKQAKPLLREDLFAILETLGSGLKDQRDKALLLVGFAGGFRRSELIGLNVGDIEQVRQGLIITLRRSKTDQEGAGRRIGIPLGRSQHCPVQALSSWLAISQITDGPIFRPVSRHGHMRANRLSGHAVSETIQTRLRSAGIDPAGYTGHSLRSGFATSATQAGVSSLKIRQQTGHATDAMLARYIREGELFKGNAAGVIL